MIGGTGFIGPHLVRQLALMGHSVSVFHRGGEHLEMKSPGKLKLTFYLLGFAGAALFTALLIREGAGQVGSAIATAGWA